MHTGLWIMRTYAIAAFGKNLFTALLISYKKTKTKTKKMLSIIMYLIAVMIINCSKKKIK
jgi:hypothetical protein